MRFKTKSKSAKEVKPGDLLFFNDALFLIDDFTHHFLNDWPEKDLRKNLLNDGLSPKTIIVDFFGEDGGFDELPFFVEDEQLDVVVGEDADKILNGSSVLYFS